MPDSDDIYRKRLASFVVSAPHHHPGTFALLPDQLAAMLAQDIAFMTFDFAAGKIFRRPAFHRPDDDFDRIVAAQGLSFGEFVAFNEARAAEVKRRVSMT
ncbi:hypothetical protein [Antrihabitans spumae]